MIARLFAVRDTPKKGKGLFATQDIPVGTIVCFECPRCRVIPAEDIAALSQEECDVLFEHAYRKRDGSALVPCDETSYLNHSCNANILYSGLHFDVVVRPIREGEEATYDYRFFYEEPDFAMACACGEPNCCETIRCSHPVDASLRAFWDARLAPAMEQVKSVAQPMRADLLAASDEFAAFLR